MLVDPVRRQRPDDPVVPPLLARHVGAPSGRGVPVVADVVVVEDHRALHRREQPAVGRLAPGDAVELGVLLVVLQLPPRRLLGVAPRRDEGADLLAGLVGVDLVAQEQQQVRQPPSVLGCGRGVERPGAQRVDAVRRMVLRVVGDAAPARPEREVDGPVVVERPDDRCGVRRPRLGPDGVVVEAQRVGQRRAGRQPVEGDQGVVVAVDGEGAGAPAATARLDGHPAGGVDLDPQGRGGLVAVAQQRPEDQGGHDDLRPPASRRRRAAPSPRAARPSRGSLRPPRPAAG